MLRRAEGTVRWMDDLRERAEWQIWRSEVADGLEGV